MTGKRRGVKEIFSEIYRHARRRFPAPYGMRAAALLAMLAAAAILSLGVPPARAQDKPKMVIDDDCQAFDISTNNEILIAVPKLKRIKKLIIERDEIDVATGSGRGKRIVDVDKFMPEQLPGGAGNRRRACL